MSGWIVWLDGRGMILEGRNIDLAKQIVPELLALNTDALDRHEVPGAGRHADALLDRRQGRCRYFDDERNVTEHQTLRSRSAQKFVFRRWAAPGKCKHDRQLPRRAT